MAQQIVQIIKTICRGKRYLKCHLELIYQFAKAKVNKIIATSLLPSSDGAKASSGRTKRREGFGLMEYCMQLLTSIIDQQSEFMLSTPQNDTVPNYFYFSGYLSGILLGDKPVQSWPFNKVSSLHI